MSEFREHSFVYVQTTIIIVATINLNKKFLKAEIVRCILLLITKEKKYIS